MRPKRPNLLYLCCGNSGLVLCHTPHTFQFHCVSSAVLQHLPALRGLRQKQTGWVTGREDTEPQQGQKWVCVLEPGLCSLFRVGQVRLSPTRHRLGLFCLVASLASAGLGWQEQRWKSRDNSLPEQQMEPVPGTPETFLPQFYCLCSFLDYGCNDKEATRDLARAQEWITRCDRSDEPHVGGVWGAESTLGVREKLGAG